MPNVFSKLKFSNSFASLSNDFYSRVAPTPFVSSPELLHFNQDVAGLIDLDATAAVHPDIAAIFSGQNLLEGSDPIAMLYAGHQFGHFVSQLGDGRAILLGEVRNAQGEPWEIQLKGSGVTPYSRNADGRAVLRSTIREYLCSEAMHALGIPTTRALCIVGSRDEVYREQIERGAMLTRLAPSHVRFGSFEVFYYRQQFDHLRTLADYVIRYHFPELQAVKNPYQGLLSEIIRRTAHLIAQWQSVGFSHGVMNTDNMSILGLTLDYGPYGFMDAYDPGYICNHSDHEGLYAYNRQPDRGLFNVSCLAQAMLPLLADDVDQAVALARDELEQYRDHYAQSYADLMRAKLGLLESQSEDQQLVQGLLDLMAADGVDFTLLFRRLCSFSIRQDAVNAPLCELFSDLQAFNQWLRRYKVRLLDEDSVDALRCQQMKQVNPKYILRNHLAEQVIRAAEDEQNYDELECLFQLLKKPFEDQKAHEKYTVLPPEWAKKLSVSCSS
ncbi:MAG: YdiU family protein [Gammaproteobacteria bacterium]|nr:YdiU family protein [Gammaproteobacteria bacterium]